MAWTYNGNRIYVQKFSESTSQILPRLQPLSGGTVIQSFGYESVVLNLSAIVVGNTIKDALLALAQDGGQYHELVAPEGTLGNWTLKGCTPTRTSSTCQTIDTNQAEDAPVFDVDLELYKEEV